MCESFVFLLATHTHTQEIFQNVPFKIVSFTTCLLFSPQNKKQKMAYYLPPQPAQSSVQLISDAPAQPWTRHHHDCAVAVIASCRPNALTKPERLYEYIDSLTQLQDAMDRAIGVEQTIRDDVDFTLMQCRARLARLRQAATAAASHEHKSTKEEDEEEEEEEEEDKQEDEQEDEQEEMRQQLSPRSLRLARINHFLK